MFLGSTKKTGISIKLAFFQGRGKPEGMSRRVEGRWVGGKGWSRGVVPKVFRKFPLVFDKKKIRIMQANFFTLLLCNYICPTILNNVIDKIQNC